VSSELLSSLRGRRTLLNPRSRSSLLSSAFDRTEVMVVNIEYTIEVEILPKVDRTNIPLKVQLHLGEFPTPRHLPPSSSSLLLLLLPFLSSDSSICVPSPSL